MKNSWERKLKSLLEKRSFPENEQLRLSVIGIGNEFGGDDGAGLEVIRRLKVILPDQAQYQLIEAGTAPENVTGAVRRFQPNQILLIDAADFGSDPGEISFLDWADTTGFSISTHSLPLKVFAGYLEDQLHCQVSLLGIQPAILSFDAPLSGPVEHAVQKIADCFPKVLTNKT